MRSGKWLWVTMAMALLLGCATVRYDKLETTLRAYEQAIRWSDFKTAFAMMDLPNASVPDFERLQHIRVTSYDKVGAGQLSADGMRLIQVIEIRFVNVNRMTDRVLIDKQVWEFSDADLRWKLKTPLPAFLQ